ncbi:MAG: 1-deoxy-D-xylulose-5-phosphate reductoisomerase [Thermodesulfobacteriota bacterium]
MKRISVLGSTGSIGIQTLDIVRIHPDRLQVSALAAGRNVDLLERQVREFRPTLVSCSTEEAAAELAARVADIGVEVVPSAEGLHRAATASDAELVVGGLPGSVGLRPTFAAVAAGKHIALATKEVLVMAGDLFMAAVADAGVNLIPVDSEQSAIFQCLRGNGDAPVERIILTASGGPFRNLTMDEMERVTRDQALRHPRWKMGAKVTVDSATLMNKGLEVIEARWLFDVPGSRIQVVIHPESIVHSMVEFRDGSILAQLGATDMRIPISYALAFPERIESGTAPVSFPALGSLNFHEPDMEKFPLLKIAYQALEAESASIIVNAADEVAVELFLQGRIPFHWISRIVLEALQRIELIRVTTLDEVEAFHEQVTARVESDWSEWLR